MIPQNVGRYQVVGELGKGAMGVVYKATDPNIGRTVALKTMRLDIHGMEAEEMLQRFRAEAHAAGVLSHPNLVTIYDAGEHESHFYIAMEYVEGDTLQKLLFQRRTLPLEQAISITRQICAGLDYAHSHGVIHRDVKPANIMVTADGTVKIMDFGIAKAGGGGLTSTGQVMGSPTYMSPEQVKGMPLDGRSDLFSVGLLLYEMVTGEKAFAAQNVTTIIYKIVHEEPRPPRELNPGLHPGVTLVIAKALAKKCEQRFQKGTELAHALENYKRVVPVAPKPAAAAPAAAPAPAVAPAPAEKAKPAPVAAPVAPTPPAAPRSASGPQPGPRAAAKTLPLPKMALLGGAAVLLIAVVVGAVVLSRRPAPAPAQSPVVAEPAAEPALPAAGEPAAPGAPDTAAAPEPSSSQPLAEPATAPTGAAPKPAAKPAVTATAPPPPSAPVPARSGDLQITSDPPGAKVQIDGWGGAAWVTPMRSPQLSAGRHTLVFSKPGYTSQMRQVEVAGGRTGNVNVELAAVGAPAPPAAAASPSPTAPSGSKSPLGKIKGLFGGGIPAGKGMLEVKTRPKGAAVSVNGRPAAERTPFKLALDPGSYVVSIALTGYRPVQKTVTVEKGKNLELNETLQAQ